MDKKAVPGVLLTPEESMGSKGLVLEEPWEVLLEGQDPGPGKA